MAPKHEKGSYGEWGSEATTEIGGMGVFSDDEIHECVGEFGKEISDGPHGYDDLHVEVSKERELTSSD